MWFNLFLAQRMGEERMKDAIREARQARLIRAARGADRAALRSLLIKVRDLGLPLISAERIEPDLEGVGCKDGCSCF